MTVYNEIFGFEDTALPVQKTLPESANECWGWQIAPATGNADATCQKILDAAFTKAILGEEIHPAQAVPEPEPVFRTPNAIRDLNKLIGELGKKWNSKKHRSAVQGIVDKFRNSPACQAIKNNATMWEALIEHATDYCCAAIHREAGEETI